MKLSDQATPLSRGRLFVAAQIRTAFFLACMSMTANACYAQSVKGNAGDPLPASEAVKPITAAPASASQKVRAFTGNWMNNKPIVGLTKPGVVPLQPEYEARLKELAQLAVAGKEVPGNEPKCIPNGPALDMNFSMRVFADAAQMVVINNGPRVRYIWLDGRAHTPDDYLFESYSGESTTHWEGDELVIDTLGLKASNEIVFGISANDSKMHMVERWKLISPSSLRIQTTLEDPVALTRPWTYTRIYSRSPLSEDVTYCTVANDRSRDGGFDLTPPAGGYVPPDAGTEPAGK